MYVLVALSIVAVARAAERANALRAQRVVPPGLRALADRLWQAREFEELERVCAADDSAFARVLLSVVKHRAHPYAEVNVAAGDVANVALKEHAQKTHTLSVIATLSPLLGLLGTVTGMITAFDAIAQAGTAANPALVANGISEALITTAGGLFVGIPALAARHFFSGRLQLLAVQLATESNALIQRWFLAERAEP